MADMMKDEYFIPSLNDKRWKNLAEKSIKNLHSFIETTKKDEKYSLVEEKLVILIKNHIHTRDMGNMFLQTN